MSVNRTDILILLTLQTNDADCSAFGLTISEMLDDLNSNGNKKSRMTVYRRLKGLTENGYVAKGILENHADTFYILASGKDLLKSTERKGT